MGAPQVRVAINGYGIIGKRVADAVAVQGSMVGFGGLANPRRLFQRFHPFICFAGRGPS